MPIRVLPSQVAAQIAAGEVVERPASAAKELIENALDAGATQVQIEARGGGLDLLRVVDNGRGIPAADTPLLFQRYATSKLEDLGRITTLGFRGEALHAIAAVSWLTLLTRVQGEEAGTYLEVREGRLLRREPRGAPVGTAVTVSRLFGSLPARRKFLRSPQGEAARLQAMVCLYALAHPSVRFTLALEGREAFASPGSGSLREAAGVVYGTEVAGALLEVWGEEGGMEAQGLAGPPSLHRSTRSYISLFVNGRPVHNRSLVYAVEEAYHGLLPEGRRPLAVLSLRVPPEEVDVNVHPTKAEVRLRREREAFVFLQRSVREALVASSPLPLLGWEGPPPLTQTSPAVARSSSAAVPSGRVLAPAATLAGRSEGPGVSVKEALSGLMVIGQVRETFIIAEGPEGLYLIDQHAAHERVLYEGLREAAARQAAQVQGLLEPAVVHLTPPQGALLQEQGPLLAQYGWSLEPFGERACLVRAIPAVLAGKAPAQALPDLLDALLSEKEASQGWEERLAATLACHGSVRAGGALARQEMEQLLRLLGACREPLTCPHGRPTLLRMSVGHLEKEFCRR